jgi:hypothetical protein
VCTCSRATSWTTLVSAGTRTHAAAKESLRTFLNGNEAAKAAKDAAKRATWEEDAYFQAAWRDVLDKQDAVRRER